MYRKFYYLTYGQPTPLNSQKISSFVKTLYGLVLTLKLFIHIYLFLLDLYIKLESVTHSLTD